MMPTDAGLDLSFFISIIVGLAIVAMVVVFFVVRLSLTVADNEDTTVRDRLKTLTNRDLKAYEEFIEKKKREEEGEINPLQSLKEDFIEFMEPVARRFYAKENPKTMEKLRHMMMLAGEPDTDEVIRKFQATRIALAAVLSTIPPLIMFLLAYDINYVLFMILLGGWAGLRWPEIRLKSRGKKRSEELYRRFPDTLDLMVVCVEGGLGLDSTIQRVGQEIEKNSPAWAQELRRVTKELNAGLPRAEVYQNLASRTTVEEIKSLCALLIQSDKLGTSIAHVLRVYADDVRIRRKQRAEELAYKASIKMTPVLVFFIFPPLFVVLIGPGVWRIFKTLFLGEQL